MTMLQLSVNVSFCFLVVVLGLCESSASGRAAVYDVIRNLSRPELIPVERDDHSIMVSVSVNLASIGFLSEIEQYISVEIFLEMYWRNELTRWDPAQFGNITSMHVPREGFWTPDIGAIYTYGDDSMWHQSKDRNFLRIEHSGDTSWFPSGHLSIYCPIDTRHFPFDVQECTLKFGSWNYASSELNISLNGDSGYGTAFLRPSSEWDIVGSPVSKLSTEVKTGNITFPSWIWYTIKLQRRSLVIVITTVAPVLVLSTLNIGLFRVPPEATDKVTCTLTILLSFSVFLGYISTSLPRNGKSTPYLTIYVGCLYIMSAIVVLLTAMTASLSKRTDEVPRCFVAMNNWMKKTPRTVDDIGACDDECAVNQLSPVTWYDLSRTIDAVFFWIFSFLFVAFSVLYFYTVIHAI